MKESRLSRPESNPLCRKCARLCRQAVTCILVDCPRFLPLPFKIAPSPTNQLDLFSNEEKP
jgi:hypothetical protein